MKSEVMDMKKELYHFVSQLTTEELVYLLYKDHLLSGYYQNPLQKQEVS